VIDNLQLANLARIWGRIAVTILIAVVVLVPSSLTMAQSPDDPTAQETPDQAEDQVVPAKPSKFNRVYDLPGRLNKEQFDRFHFDIGRLWNHDLPAMIYIRTSSADEAESQWFADQLRDTWDIETAPGADDGLVLLVTIRETFPKTAQLSLSFGANTFPTGQMTLDVLNTVLEEEANPRLDVGNVNGGLTYALRRIIYYTEYTAPFPEERSTAQDIAHNIAIPFTALSAIGLLALVWLPEKWVPSWLKRNGRTRSIAIGCALVILSLVVAVFGRSPAGTGNALVGLVLLGVLLWSAGREPDKRRTIRSNPRRIFKPRLVRTQHRA
jgi:uncharacterized membrane protein YgcG